MKRFLLTTSVLLASAAASFGADFHVDAIFGNDGTGTGSAAAPWRTLTFSVNIAIAGDTLLLHPGVYSIANGESFPITLQSGVNVRGAGPHVTVIDGAGGPQAPLLSLKGDAVVSGVRFKNNPSGNWWDGAITSWTAGTVEISGNVFEGPMNRAVMLYDFGASPTSVSSATIFNNIVFNVGPADGILVFDYSQVLIAHNTVAHGARSGFAVSQINGSVLGTIADNVIYDAGWYAFEGTAPGIVLAYNDLWQTQGIVNGSFGSQVNTLQVAPLFLSPVGNDFRLKPASALKDAGIDMQIPVDHDGDPRPFGGAPDIGADEITLPSAALLAPFVQGQTTRVDTIGDAGKSYAQFIGFIPAAIPTQYGTLAFDPAFMLILTAGVLPATGFVSTAFTVPPAPAAVGFPLIEQALVGFQSNSLTTPIAFAVIQ